MEPWQGGEDVYRPIGFYKAVKIESQLERRSAASTRGARVGAVEAVPGDVGSPVQLTSVSH